MKRVVILAMAFVFLVAATASAQEPQAPGNAAPVKAASQFSNVFSKAAIEKAVARATAASLNPAPAPAPKVPRGAKAFFKTPWPYIIAGAVIAGVVIAVNSGSNGTTGSGY